VDNGRSLNSQEPLSRKPTLLLLDEPASGLSPQNVNALLNIIERLRSDMKITILLVEHVIKLVMEFLIVLLFLTTEK
jgi:branched-chain amino acid transport system ATP-binding protein